MAYARKNHEIERMQLEGERLYKEKKLDDATKVFRGVLLKDENNAKAWICMGDCFTQKATKTNAIIALESIVLDLTHDIGKVDGKLEGEKKRMTVEVKSAIIIASKYYREAKGILDGGRDSSSIEDPRGMAERCGERLEALKKAKVDSGWFAKLPKSILN